MTAAAMSDSIRRNPHGDFEAVEASRPAWTPSSGLRFTKTVAPDWKFGDGANRLRHEQQQMQEQKKKQQGRDEGGKDKGKDPDAASSRHVPIDPHADGRPAAFNYKLLISAVVPRPIGFVSTRSADGTSENLAPFSYFNLINHDPPLFVLGFSCGTAAVDGAKDSLRNLLETEQCVIGIISESFLEAANATSVDAPYGVSEWLVSGLTPVRDCHTVRCARVHEAVFSIEARLVMVKEWDSKARPGRKSGTMVVVEGTRFWARQDALNEEQNLVDPSVSVSLFFHSFILFLFILSCSKNSSSPLSFCRVSKGQNDGHGARICADRPSLSPFFLTLATLQILRPVSRLGGITYGRVTEAVEIPRPSFEKDVGGRQGVEAIKAAARETQQKNPDAANGVKDA